MASVTLMVLAAMVVLAALVAVSYAALPSVRRRWLFISKLPLLGGLRGKRVIVVSEDVAIAIQDFRKRIQEAVVMRSVAFWSKACIDTTLYYYDTKATLLEELAILEKSKTKRDLIRLMPWFSGSKFVLWLDVTILKPYETEAMLNKFWSPQMRAFRQRRDLWTSTSATSFAMEMLFELTTYTKCKFLRREVALKAASKRFPEWIAGSEKFIERSIDDATGMISDIPGETPSISSNHCGWISFRDLDIVHKILTERNLQDKFVKALRAYLVEGGEGNKKDKWQAFSDVPGGEPSICASHHALAGIAATNNMDLIVNSLGLKWSRLLKFVARCGKDGGFAARIGEENTIIHTRYALALFRSVVNSPHFKSKHSNRNIGSLFTKQLGTSPKAVVAFIDSLWTPLGARLSKSSFPSIYSTRAALLVLKYLELFRVNGFFTADAGYISARDSLLRRIRGDFDRFESLYKVEDGFHGFPHAANVG